MSLGKEEEERESTEDDVFFISTNEWFAAVKLQTLGYLLLLLLQDDPFADGGWASLGPSKGPEEGVVE